MRCDIAIAGVAGQGVTTISSLVERAALATGLHLMRGPAAREGESITIRLLLADHPVDPPTGEVDLVLSLDLGEGVRWIPRLAPSAALVCATDCAAPPGATLADLLWSVLRLRTGYLVDAARLAAQAGGLRASNSVLLGAAADFLPLEAGTLRDAIAECFRTRGDRAVTVNLDAFEAGRRSLRHRELVDEFDTFVRATPD